VVVVYNDVKDEACDKVSPTVVELSEAALPSVRHRRLELTGLGRAAATFMVGEGGCAFGGADEEAGEGFHEDEVMDFEDCVDDDVEDEYDRDRDEDWLEVDRGEATGGGGDGGETPEDMLNLMLAARSGCCCCAFVACCCWCCCCFFRSRSST
jgi:hypothetical protein